MTSTSLRFAMGCALALFVVACGQEEAPQQIPDYDFPLQVEATDLNGDPVASIPVSLDGELVGFTDADGNFEATLTEQPDTPVTFGVDDIDGFRLVSDETQVETNLQLTQALEGGYRGIPITLRVQLRSLLDEYLVWVSAECDDDLDDKYCDDLPVLLDGDEVTRTDYRGHAHFTFEGLPGDTHEVSITTPAHDEDDDDSVKIEPASPDYEFELSADTTVYHINEAFTDPDAEAAPPPRPRPRPRPRPQPSPTPSNGDGDSSGPIQLF